MHLRITLAALGWLAFLGTLRVGAETVTFHLDRGGSASVDVPAMRPTHPLSRKTINDILDNEKQYYTRGSGYKRVVSDTTVNGYNIGNNLAPTAAQNCAGLAMARLIGGPYNVDPKNALPVLTTFGFEVKAPRKGDVAVWSRDGTPVHFAVVDEVTRAIGYYRVWVFSKDGQERVYRGRADNFPKSYGQVKYYRVPWNAIRVKKLSSPPTRPIRATGFALSGTWSCNDGGTYILQQRGSKLTWLGRSSDNGRTWTNVLQATIQGKRVRGSWRDIAPGRHRNKGILDLELVITNGRVVEIRRKSATGTFGGSRWWPRAGRTAAARPGR